MRTLYRAALPVLAALALTLGGCAARSPQSFLAADAIPDEEKQAFEVRPGMSRDAVESVLGIPTHLAETKEGNAYAHYDVGQRVMRAVVYDARDRVVVAYP